MQVVIVKYNAGNIQSVLFALERIAVQGIVTDDPGQIIAADKVIFPGVGEARSAMRYLRERKLDEVILQLKQPVLGICLGMQLLCADSEENDTACLGVFPGVPVKRFAPENNEWKVPQVGWNCITGLQGSLFTGMEEKTYCYFVHGYYAPVNGFTIARADYDGLYSAAMQKDNFYAVQFHPEKSAGNGEMILKNFLAL